MTGFYEWKTEGKRKVKYKIFLPDEDIFFVPAIYNQDKEKNIFASLITTVPNKFIKEIHHRMPVILDLDNAISFLGDESEKNLERCVPYDDKKKMEMKISD
jgi:putative SOS response-associated peptidase YedK